MIIVQIWEGLGNQLFQYAFARSLQLKYKKDVLLDNKGYLDEAFARSRKNELRKYGLDNYKIRARYIGEQQIKKYSFILKKTRGQRCIAKLSNINLWPYRVHVQSEPMVYDESVFLKNNVYYKGWFQNPLYFEFIRNELLREIVPKRKIKISKRLKKILNNKNTVAVHIRRGDYQYYGNCLPVSYYYRAISFFKEKLKNPQFLVFSDDIRWAREHLTIQDATVYMDEFSRYEDFEELFIMSRCHHNIIANSTFSWWGAWLNPCEDKIVIAPKCWHGNKGTMASDSIIPVDWIKM